MWETTCVRHLYVQFTHNNHIGKKNQIVGLETEGSDKIALNTIN